MPREIRGRRRAMTTTASVETLTRAVTGRVLLPHDPDFETARVVWNRRHQGRPAVILRCATPDDVARGIAFAREQGLPLAVRGAGYAPSGSASCDDGLVLDLRPMRPVRADPAAGTVVVAGGATWADVDPVTQQYGTVVPGVPLSGIGVAGSTLSGGYGHLRRAYGLACDSLVGAHVVTADGRRVTASGDENSDLLWGLRGGGGNFGVVTSLTFRMRPLPAPLLAGSLVFAAEHAERVVRAYHRFTTDLRDDITTRLSFLSARHSMLAAGRVGVLPVVAVSVACMGPSAVAEAAVRPLRSAAPVLQDLLAPQPYLALQTRVDAAYPPGAHADVASEYLADLDDTTLGVLVEQFRTMPPGSAELHVDHMGGAVGRVAPMATAVPHRREGYLTHGLTRWSDGADPAPHDEWLTGTFERVRAGRAGAPHIGLETGRLNGTQVYGTDRHLRLAALKQRWDPDNVFTRNLNVLPLR